MPAHAQQNLVDSLRSELAKSKKEEALLYSKIGQAFASFRGDSAVFYDSIARKTLKPGASKAVQYEVAFGHAAILNSTSKYKKAIESFLVALSYAQELNDSTKIAQIYTSLGRTYNSIGSYEPALKYLEESRLLKLRLKDTLGSAAAYLQMGVIYNERGDFENSQRVLFLALRIYEKKNDLSGKSKVYNNLGSVYINQEQHLEGLRYYQQALAMKKEIGANKRDLAGAYSNVGVAFFGLKNLDSALFYYSTALRMKEDIGEDKGIAIALNNIGLVYREKKNFPEAQRYLLRALGIRREIDDRRGIASTLTSLASVYSRQAKYAEAIPMLEEAIQISAEIKSVSQQIEISREMADAYAGAGNYEKAYKAFREYKRIEDSIFTREREDRINNIKGKYEKEVQDRKIKELEQSKREDDLRALAEKEKNRNQYYLLGAGALLMLIGIGFLLLRNRENQRSRLRLQKAYDEIETKNNDITASIRYAKRIQASVLPEAGEMERLFPDSFVLYKPKDIVSGDFYWVAKSSEENNFSIIAVADCTGHGVPGAFMSLIGANYLEQTATDPMINDCTMALDFLDRSIQQYLKQHETGESKDGMDIALCAFNKNTNQLMFAGAFRPLILIQQGVLTEIPGSRFSIGGAYTAQKHFESHIIQLRPGDVFYIFTDGYADQFGGPDGKKFKSRRLKELLLEIHRLPMQTQKEKLEAAYENWRGNLEQIDDVCVAGVRIV
jgi:serine phosphatase RsbU (regulator of sigma subunit)/tetratricopeptide (TPR) repeat protein